VFFTIDTLRRLLFVCNSTKYMNIGWIANPPNKLSTVTHLKNHRKVLAAFIRATGFIEVEFNQSVVGLRTQIE
jgi:hypothetical protein